MRKKYIIGSMVLVATAAAVVTISANGISGNTASDITGSSEIAYETTIEESEAKLAISEKNTVGAGKSSEESEEDALKEYFEDKAIIDTNMVKKYVKVYESDVDDKEDEVVIGKINADTVVTVSQVGEKWTRVRSGSVKGWVRTQNLIFGDEAAKKVGKDAEFKVVIQENKTKAYKEADINSEVVTTLKEETSHKVKEKNENWIKVSTDDGNAYLRLNNVTLKWTSEKAEAEKESREAEEKASKEAEAKKAKEEESKKAAESKAAEESWLAESKAQKEAAEEASRQAAEAAAAQAAAEEASRQAAAQAAAEEASRQAAAQAAAEEASRQAAAEEAARQAAAQAAAEEASRQAAAQAAAEEAARQAAAQAAAEEAARQAAAQQAAQQQQHLGKFRITHYCSCPICCGQWSTGSSTVIGASGMVLTPGQSIAVNPAQIPYGSKVMINGQIYIAADTGVGSNCIDIYTGTNHAVASAGGMYYADVYLVK